MNVNNLESMKEYIRSGYYEGFIYPSGLVYHGGIYRGLPHGMGMIILPNGEEYEYKFRNGKLIDGRAIIVYPDASFYEGEVSESGYPSGHGTVRNRDGSIFFSGIWKNNYDPKIVWVCGPPPHYYKGEVIQSQNASLLGGDLLLQGAF